MSIIITTAYQGCLCEFTQSFLIGEGLNVSNSTTRHNYSPEAIVKKMSEAYSSKDMEVTSQQHAPGKTWQLIAADLMVANAGKQPWGWAATENLPFLNFWREFEPNCLFLLIYSTPQDAIMRQLSENSLQPRDVPKALQHWQVYHAEMLRFFHTNTDRSTLVNVAAIQQGRDRFSNLCAKRFGLLDSITSKKPTMPKPPEPIIDLMVSSLTEELLDADYLFQELESSADLADLSEDKKENSFAAAWSEYNSLRTSLEESSTSLDRSISDNKAVVAAANKEKALLTSQLAKSQADAEGINEENRLLVEQLRQTQTELEYYFLKYQESNSMEVLSADADGKSGPPSVVNNQPPLNNLSAASTNLTVIDMRHFVDGTNWYHAEPDGRWAGPDLTSHVSLPELEDGTYTIELDIVDAMDESIIDSLSVSLNGKQLNMSRRNRSDLKGMLAPFRRTKLSLQGTTSPYPILLKGRCRIEKQHNNDRNVLLLKFSKTISPASRGEEDTRELTIRLRQLKIWKN